MQSGSVDFYEYLHESRKILNLLKNIFKRLLLSQLLSQRHTLKCFTLLKIYFKRAFKIFYANFQLLAFCLALVAPLFLLHRHRSGCHPTTRARNEPSPKFPQSQPQQHARSPIIDYDPYISIPISI